jgi:hypothetical protein
VWSGLNEPKGVAINDYDNDNLTETAITGIFPDGTVTVYKNDGVTVLSQLTGLTTPIGVAIGDYNNDGLNELAYTEQGQVTVIPEFLIYLIFPLLIATTLLAVTVYRRHVLQWAR